MFIRLIELENGLRAILVSDVQNIIDLNSLASNDSDESGSEDSISSIEDEAGQLESEVRLSLKFSGCLFFFKLMYKL